MKPASMDRLFQALASSSRRAILDIVGAEPGCSVMDVCRHFDVSRIAVMKHIGILENADLLITEKKGRTRRLYFNAVPIQMIYQRWTSEYSRYWSGQVPQIKSLSEQRHSRRTAPMTRSNNDK